MYVNLLIFKTKFHKTLYEHLIVYVSHITIIVYNVKIFMVAKDFNINAILINEQLVKYPFLIRR